MKSPPEPANSRQSTFDFYSTSGPRNRELRDLEEYLQRLVGEALSGVVLTDNRRRILSTQADPRTPGRVQLRLHRSFLSAGDDLLALVADFALGRLHGNRRRLAVAAFREHFDRHGPQETLLPPSRRKVPLRPEGSYFALEEMRDRLIEAYFANETFPPFGKPPSITWARRPRPNRRRPRRRSLRLGSYDANRHLIRIHPLLDHHETPRFVVESIVHHELLHAMIPIVRPGLEAKDSSPRAPRRRLHTPEFRHRERLFAHHGEAEAWLEKNLDRLLERRQRSR